MVTTHRSSDKTQFGTPTTVEMVENELNSTVSNLLGSFPYKWDYSNVSIEKECGVKSVVNNSPRR